MSITVIPLVKGTLEPVQKLLEKRQRTGDQEKNPEPPDHISVKIR